MRSNKPFSKLSAVALLLALIVLIVGSGSLGSRSIAAQGATTAATAGGTAAGNVPPCPTVKTIATAAATQGGAAAPQSAAAMPTMQGTRDAARQGMMTNSCQFYAMLSGAEEVPPTNQFFSGTAQLYFSSTG